MSIESEQESEDIIEQSGDESIEQDQEVEQGDEQQANEPEDIFSLSDDEVMGMESPAGDAGESSDDEDEEPFPEGRESKPEPQADADEKDSDGGEPERDIVAEHAKIFSPFKANGQELTLRSAEEAITLMQQGANYHSKMEKIAGQMKTIKTLEKAGISGDQLNYLIDLHNKNPQAINKLIADAEIDPMDLDTDEDNNAQYRPKNYAPSDEDLALESVIEELKQTPTYSQLIDVVGDQWDDASRNEIAKDNSILRVINGHMARGVYPIVEKELARQRALGHLRGLNDLAAYQQVGQEIMAAGGFSELLTSEAQAPVQGQNSSPAATSMKVRPAQGSRDLNLNAKRRAASPTKAASTAKGGTNRVNPLTMSDEDFEKQIGTTLS